MARIFITGSSDGIGLLAAKKLISDGHDVVLHARNEKRRDDILKEVQGAEAIVTGDLSDIEDTKALSYEINKSGVPDAIIHNAGVYNVPGKQILAVNVLAPYILTCLIHKPKRLIYISSSMHLQGKPNAEYFKTDSSHISYSDSKLHVLMLCKAVARKWPDVYANAVNPGWVPTKMGGSSATDDLQKGYETQVWLAVSNDKKAKVSGEYFFHQKRERSHPDADSVELQDKLLKLCEGLTGVSLDNY